MIIFILAGLIPSFLVAVFAVRRKHSLLMGILAGIVLIIGWTIIVNALLTYLVNQEQPGTRTVTREEILEWTRYSEQSDGESTLAIDNDYFIGAIKIRFVESGKEITDNQTISEVLGHLEVTNSRRDPCKCDGLYAEVTMKDNNRVTIKLTPHGWGFKEDQGNVRYLKDPGAFNQLYEKLWEKYGPTSYQESGQMYLYPPLPLHQTNPTSPLPTDSGGVDGGVE